MSQQFSQRSHATMPGLGAGVMLAACAFSLTIAALGAARSLGIGAWGAGGMVVALALRGGGSPVDGSGTVRRLGPG